MTDVSTEETRLVKTGGHGRIEFNREESEKLRKHLPRQNTVLNAKCSWDKESQYAVARWSDVARRRPLYQGFSDDQEAIARSKADPEFLINDLKGIRVRFIDDGRNVLLYLGSRVCIAGLGRLVQHLNGSQKISVVFDGKKIVLRRA